ncbi:phage baseplate protein [Burkholderia stagnalis]|uniref:baseplate J/gp47 family protein n=1 Tax=Burkholderia stagnalis TaxID=1503054 RepID=UPI0007569939|nr:baseplate J/gp47 family protein [Burkholderia stagnalis]KVZ18645.1 phage baseplate protein [Burkholderia stagnalis]KWN32868.1 phage baseplate protein [Burkholderia stagnalis]KWN44695.1 phage baseplate protein [Burkholderia stagnalis]KWN54428.1 phage baseplate protein [Burkholderia stagnalis]KWO68835.1 phage baseplate protein [Burkholderia stagnalis]
MPFARPTLTELRSQVASDIASAVKGSDPLLRYSNLKITGDAQAGLAHLHYGYLDWISKQSVPWTSSGEFLAAWGALKGVYQKDATSASGTITFPGTAGTVINSGVSIVRGDGVAYTTTASATVGSNGSLTVAAQTVSAGADGNCDAGVQMTLGTAIPGIQSTGSAATAFTGGADQETEDSFYARVMAAYQASPQGGAKSDYPTWAKAVSGVTRAWCMPYGFGAGTIVVYAMLDQANASNQGFPQGSNGISSSDVLPNGNPRGTVAMGDQLAIANAIYPLQPVTALVYVCAPLPNSLAFTISGLTNASTTTRSAVQAAISEVLTSYGDPRGGTIDLSYIESAIAAVPNTAGFVITNVVGTQGGSQTTYPGNITSQVGYLPVLGSVTFS